MSGHKPSNSQLQSSWTSRLYCILYFPASFKMSGTTHPVAEQHILEYMNLLLSISFSKRLHLECVPHSHFNQNFLFVLLTFSIPIWMKCILVQLMHITIYSATVSHRCTVQKLVNNSIWSSHLRKTPRRKHNLLIKKTSGPTWLRQKKWWRILIRNFKSWKSKLTVRKQVNLLKSWP